jgi:hypothetical protein
LGFWLYLMGDAVIFALLFATYAIMIPGIAGGPTGKDLFDLDNAAIETALLLVSSMTFGFASLQVKAGNRGAVLLWLAITFRAGRGLRVPRGARVRRHDRQGRRPRPQRFPLGPSSPWWVRMASMSRWA